MAKDSMKTLFAVVLSICVAFAVGLLIGWFAKPGSETASASSSADPEALREAALFKRNFLVNTVSNTSIQQNLRRMTRQPHLAGTAESKALAEDLIEKWKSYGFETKMLEYEVLLSYPGNGTGNWNQVFINEGGNRVFASKEKEEILDPEQDNPKVVPPFNAYTKAAQFLSSKLVYANYGRREDFLHLQNKSVVIAGSVAIMRYGKIYRGNKVAFAQEFGCLGVILYSDPKDVTIEGKDTPETTFPNSWWLPPTGVQRGSTKLGDGDPTTRLYPTREFSYRDTVEDIRASKIIPSIPSNPIGYGDAYHFLKLLTGEDVVDDWQGNLNFTYKYGGDLAVGTTVEIKNNNEERLSPAYNAIGVMKGSVEPDRYVIMGNHRDAWAFGAVDATTGTATMLEVSRALYKLSETGWRPRRSLVFCSWGAEEYGLIGSMEYVEEYIQNLKQRSVIYLNVDIAAYYNFVLEVSSSMLIKNHIYEITKQIPEPDKQYENLFEGWMHKTEAHVGDLSSGSDYAPFYATAGVTSVDVSYIYNTTKWKIALYPLYHSVYETYDLVERFIDPGFYCQQAVGRFSSLMLQTISDAPVIPYDTNTLADKLVDMHATFIGANRDRLSAYSEKLGHFEKAIVSFKVVSAAFMKRVKAVDVNNLYELRMINDQLMYLERAFLDPMGLPGRPQYKNMVFAPSSENSYGAAGFAGVTDTIAIAERTEDAVQKEAAWKQVDRELSKVIHIIESLGSTLADVNVFYRIDD